ncbi:MAG: malectin domain-containing carbohydrate-binding protein, partial [Nocardioidaceae bacterium]
MRRAFVLLFSSLLVLVGLTVAPTSAVQDVTHDGVVKKNPDNWTPHVLEGEVNALVEVGQWIVAGGDFSQVQAATGGPVLTRNSIMAFNKSTGAISTTFVPQLDGVVKALATGPNGTVYVGGNFNNANGSNAFKITQLNISDGSKVTDFKPGLTNAIVQDIRFVAGRLFMGGSFTEVQGETRNRLAELDPTTGTLLSRTNVSFEGTHFGGNTQIYHMDVSPDGSKLVAIGNFITVDGQDRVEAAVVDIGGATSSVSSWQTDRYKPRCYNVFKFIVRDVEFSPDGSYFVIGTTGGFGPGSPSLCDTATRWESDATGAGQNPTWIDYTGGDSLYSVAVTGSVVYVGGHNRWMNNPSRADAEGPGAVNRSGIAALDPVNGLPLSWNPGRKRGQGVFDMLATTEGLFIGSDTDRVNGEYHGRIAYFPLLGGGPVPQPEPPDLPADVYSLGPLGTSPVLFRVNAGGPTVASTDSGPDWLADNGLLGTYRNFGSNAAAWSAIPAVDATVPSGTPRAIFDSERWDPSSFPEMEWNFPVATGTNIEVRLYLSNRCDCTDQVGERRFNVSIDGQPKLTAYDLIADVGDDTGTMKSFNVTSDGNVDIDFGHVLENPLVNGIEIVNRDLPPGPDENGAVKRSYDGSDVGATTPVSS